MNTTGGGIVFRGGAVVRFVSTSDRDQTRFVSIADYDDQLSGVISDPDHTVITRCCRPLKPLPVCQNSSLKRHFTSKYCKTGVGFQRENQHTLTQLAHLSCFKDDSDFASHGRLGLNREPTRGVLFE